MPDATRLQTRVARPALIRIYINNREALAYPGETVVTALLAAGVSVFRRSHGHAAHAPVCNMGVCFECLVTIDGCQSVRSCMTLATEGMRIEVPPNVE
ncbi:(2Fe-2S)-binding protein [Achromobacter anxifer]|uniref:Hydrogen cyanide synthase subunit HcnA n=1 Tax=Achromobacter anxifer TaxID=1287737 RepID=A0A6S7DQJ4_9BURK|nr:(2Fe-2S)-binding protein [Achromobacter anxifer]MDF8360286.1 (2Fe-2S)-binding protein [Achromobacter anxifer]CAB3875527.1 Hydrogen cyanide synthase subunit HcnA [Achromobacter anxifer]CAB5516242.1 Hydrogen cyanide synthase subunit HcnA [Achromobacter anxifer]